VRRVADQRRCLGVDDDQSERIRADLRAGRSPAVPGAVRASIGLGTTTFDVARIVEAVTDIAQAGPAWSTDPAAMEPTAGQIPTRVSVPPPLRHRCAPCPITLAVGEMVMNPVTYMWAEKLVERSGD